MTAGPTSPGSYPSSPPEGTPPLGSQPSPSKTWKYLFIGCAILALLGVIMTAGTCYYLGRKGPGIFASLLKMGKPEAMEMLTPDHTEEERQNFSNHFDAYLEAMQKEGFPEMQKLKVSLREFQFIAADKTITVEESQDWCEHLDQALGESIP